MNSHIYLQKSLSSAPNSYISLLNSCVSLLNSWTAVFLCWIVIYGNRQVYIYRPAIFPYWKTSTFLYWEVVFLFWTTIFPSKQQHFPTEQLHFPIFKVLPSSCRSTNNSHFCPDYTAARIATNPQFHTMRLTPRRRWGQSAKPYLAKFTDNQSLSLT